MKWREISGLQTRLANQLPGDSYFAAVLTGAMTAARDVSNPIRGNLFAAAFRELITYVLHSLAPDEQVRACPWFVQAKDTKTVTRMQRATYITQGGLTDAFVEEELDLLPGEMHQELMDAMNELNKLTHIQPETVVAKGRPVRELVANACIALLGLFDAARECRSAIERELAQHVDRDILDRLISEVDEDLDLLSTHTRIEDHASDEITVTRLDQEMITYAVSGQVYVELQYGSGSDVRSGIGDIQSDSYPYEATLQASVREPKVCLAETIQIKVDTSEFYE